MARRTNSPVNPGLARLDFRVYLVVGAGLLSIAAIGWAYMAYMNWGMNHMDMVDMWMPPQARDQWTFTDFMMLFLMWDVMMIAMMIPSIAPMVVMFNRVGQNKKRRGGHYVPTFVFITGYLIAWSGFSMLISFAQWPLHTAGVLSPMMNNHSYLFSGSVLIAAGLYQWTPFKEACLHQCRSPLGFLMTNWREGKSGALNMGIRHGVFCVGCCWALMLVLFAVGVMNLLWMLLLTLFVLIEKIFPAPTLMRLVSGFGLVFWGVWWVLV